MAISYTYRVRSVPGCEFLRCTHRIIPEKGCSYRERIVKICDHASAEKLHGHTGFRKLADSF